MADLDAIFKAYDIRGTFPDQIDADTCRSIGAAFARFALDEGGPVPEILVARDMRPSGVELVVAFSEGARSQGVDVVDLGLASTDLVYFASGRRGAPGAMFTASHNPAQYNGIKFCLAGARPVGVDSGLDVVRRLVDSPPQATSQAGALRQLDLLGDFADHVRSFVDVDGLSPLSVVADVANGMGGLVVPAVFDGLKPRLEVMFGELDGTFPNHPADPLQPENQADLRARVLEVGADVGLAFDGDADRVFLVDELGQGLSGSTTTAIIAAAMLADHPGATIIHNLIVSKAVPEAIAEHGGVAVRTRVGHSFIKAVMADRDALFGGEHSAHYYFADNYRADSGLIAALVVLAEMSRSGQPLSELRKPYERYVASGEINSTVTDPTDAMARVEEAFMGSRRDHLDGLTVDLGDWWFNLRASNTEPLLRLNLEARTRDECDAHTSELLHLITKG
jgi:phosphomannomutase